jgi:large exoprotein involved in heme utilization and adhesion
LLLDNQASLRSDVRLGNEGNIRITADAVIMRRGSQISTNAGTNSNGGNIVINAPIIAGFENSDIVANAVRGRGGTIQITTQGIFGLQFRNQLTPESDITASSQFGINGTVKIITPGIDPDASSVPLNMDLLDSTQQVIDQCADRQGNSFVATGRGGIPINPTQEVRKDRPWVDTRDFSDFRKPGSQEEGAREINIAFPPPLVEANAIRRNPNGSIDLIADHTVQMPQWETCMKALK